MAGDQATSDPRGHLATCGTCAGLFPGLRPEGRHSCPPVLRLSPAQVYPVFCLLGALLGAARRASPRTPLPRATALLLRLPTPGPLLRSTPAHLGPSQGKPPYLPVPHFGKYGHRVSALQATDPRRAWAGGLCLAGSLESLRQILFFTCSPTSHLVIKSWVATCRRMRAGLGIYSASPSPRTSQS